MLAISPAYLYATLEIDQTDVQVLTVHNYRPLPLDFALEVPAGASWLSVDPISGTLPAFGSTPVDVTLCDGTGAPGSCSGVASVLLEAEASYPAAMEVDPWDEVRFYYTVPSSGVWALIGTTSDFEVTDQGFLRYYTYEYTLVGDDSLPVGPIEVIAVGVIFDQGEFTYGTVPNTKITVEA